MRTLAGWCVRHRRLVLLLWAGRPRHIDLPGHVSSSADYTNNFKFPHTESSDAIKLLQSATPGHSGDTEEVVFGTSGGAVSPTPPSACASTRWWTRSTRCPTSPTSRAPTTRRATWSHDQHQHRPTRWASFRSPFDKQAQQHLAERGDAIRPHRDHHVGLGLTVAVTGQLAEFANNQSFSSTGLGVLLALIVLLLVFGSVFAALLPIVSALFALGTAIGVIGLLSHLLKMPQFSPGAGPAHRPGCRRRLRAVHRDPASARLGRRARHRSSIINAVNTSGRAVLFAGHHRVHRPARHVRPRRELPLRPGDGGGHRCPLHHDRRPDPAAGAARLHRPQGDEPQAEAEPGRERAAHRRRRQQGFLAEVGRPGPALPWSRPGALVVIVVLALPFFSLRLGSADQGTDPAGTTTRAGVRPAGQGLRARLQRARCAGGSIRARQHRT